MVAICCFALLLAGCGGSRGGTPPLPSSFTLTASASSLLVSQGSTSAAVELNVQSVNGFQGTVSVNLQGLPAGVTTSPAFPLSINAGSSQSATFTVGNTVPRGNYSVTFAGTSGTLAGSDSLLLTASGGAFRDWPKERLASATPADALRHPFQVTLVPLFSAQIITKVITQQ